MDLQDTKIGEALVVAMDGRLDSMTSNGFEQALETRLNAGETKLVLDMGKLAFVSSAGLRVLLTVAKKLRASGGTLAVCNPSDMAREVLELSGFLSFITVYADSAEASAALSGS